MGADFSFTGEVTDMGEDDNCKCYERISCSAHLEMVKMKTLVVCILLQ